MEFNCFAPMQWKLMNWLLLLTLSSLLCRRRNDARSSFDSFQFANKKSPAKHQITKCVQGQKQFLNKCFRILHQSSLWSISLAIKFVPKSETWFSGCTKIHFSLLCSKGRLAAAALKDRWWAWNGKKRIFCRFLMRFSNWKAKKCNHDRFVKQEKKETTRSD